MRILFPTLLLLLLVWLWLRSVLVAWTKIESICSENLWPRRWVLFAFVPLSRILVDKIVNSTSHGNTLRVSQIREDKIEKNIMPRSNWILLEEQYDVKTSDHHGTRLHNLDQEETCNIVSFSKNDEPSNYAGGRQFIDIGSPRPLGYTKRWAQIKYDSLLEGWRIQNMDADSVIPVLTNGESQKVKYCLRDQGGASKTTLSLNSGDIFLAGTSDFRFLQLPHLAVCLDYKGKKHIKSWQDSEVTFGSLSDNTISVNLKGVSGHHWAIKQDILNCKAKIHYFPLGSHSQMTVLDARKKMQVFPGDKFKIPGTYLMFEINYF